jgi:transposase
MAMKPPRFVRPLTEAERQEVEELFRHGPTARIRRRAQAVRLSALGYSVPQITEILGCTPQSVHNWLTAFEAGGGAALVDKERSGRPPVATSSYRQQLVEAIKDNPRDLGYPFTVWTVTRLRAHLARQLSILLSESRVRQIMKEEGLVFKRPQHTLAGKRDEDAFREMRDLLARVKKSPWNPVPL